MTDSEPLAGMRVVVTRARPQAADLSDPLRRLGAEVVEAPVIEIDDPVDGGAALRGGCGPCGGRSVTHGWW